MSTEQTDIAVELSYTNRLTADFEKLAHRAVACKQWRWMPGMRVIVPSKRKGNTGCFFRVNEFEWCSAEGDLPDLSDPATRGCLLAIVREASRADGFCCYARPEALWRYYTQKGKLLGQGITETEALVAALEAVW